MAAAADLADEIGYGALNLSVLAERLGVKPPALYKHVANLADLQHRVATLAMNELADVIGRELQGKARLDALTAMFVALRGYVAEHPGRYASTNGAEFDGTDDPLYVASARVIDSIAAVLSGYGISADQSDHAIRTLRCTVHGFASLHAANAFQWAADPEESFRWMIGFLDAGLREIGRVS